MSMSEETAAGFARVRDEFNAVRGTMLNGVILAEGEEIPAGLPVPTVIIRVPA